MSTTWNHTVRDGVTLLVAQCPICGTNFGFYNPAPGTRSVTIDHPIDLPGQCMMTVDGVPAQIFTPATKGTP